MNLQVQKPHQGMPGSCSEEKEVECIGTQKFGGWCVINLDSDSDYIRAYYTIQNSLHYTFKMSLKNQ